MLPVRLDVTTSLILFQNPMLVILSITKVATGPHCMASYNDKVVELVGALVWLGHILFEHLRCESMKGLPQAETRRWYSRVFASIDDEQAHVEEY